MESKTIVPVRQTAWQDFFIFRKTVSFLLPLTSAEASRPGRILRSRSSRESPPFSETRFGNQVLTTQVRQAPKTAFFLEGQYA